MNFIKKYPSELLQPFVRNYWMYEIAPEEVPFKQLCFPYGSFELIVFIEGSANMFRSGNTRISKQEKSFYSGQFTNSFELHFSEPCKCLGVSFYPWAGNQLYGVPSEEFSNHTIQLDLIENNSILYEQLLAAADTDEMFRFLEIYLELKLAGKIHDKMVDAVTRQIIYKPESKLLCAYLEKNVGLSKRRIQQRFLAATGLTMTNFIRKLRFQKSLHTLQRLQPMENLTQIGLEAGYYDQPHFINEFRTFAGITPSQFVAQNSDLKDFIRSLVIT